jgi:hypothetical protein
MVYVPVAFTIINSALCIYGFSMILSVNFMSVNILIFVMANCCVLFEVLTEFLNNVRFQVLTAASTKMTAFWDIAPCSLVEVDRRFRREYCSIIRTIN